jgi:fermentation-respiration switch protein FrsA (DUF1100 family)
VSYKELTFEAALRAYDDAGIDPRKDVDSFVAVSEDFWEGTSIFDEYVPDQIGGALRPVHTVSADGLFAVATAVMVIRSGAARVVAVEGHSKASDVLSLGSIHQFALDPVYNRPLNVSPLAVAGLILVSAYDSIVNLAASIYFFLPVRPLIKDRFRSDLWIGDVKQPKLFVHGQHDAVIPIRHGQALYELAPEPKRMLVYDAHGHNDIWGEGLLGDAEVFG